MDDNRPTGLEFATEAAQLYDAVATILRPYHSYVQGAVLADMLAMWLAGHSLIGDRKGTREMREGLLAEHIKHVRELIPQNEKMLAERSLNPTRHHN